MKDRLRVFPMKALAAFCLLSGMCPIFLLFGRLLAADAPLLWTLLPASALIWGIVGFLMPGKGRMPFTVLGCALFAGFGALFLLPGGWQRLFLVLPCMVFLLLLPPAWSRPVWEEWPVGAWMSGIILHLFAQFVSTWPVFEGVQPYLLPAFAGYAFLFLLSMNRQGLRDGMHGTAKAPLIIRRRNMALLIVFFLICFAAACWDRLAEWTGVAWDYLRLVIAAIVEFFMGLLPSREMTGQGGGGDLSGMLGLEEGETSPLALFLEKVVQALTAIVLAVFVILFLRMLFKGAIRLWKRLMERLRRYAADSGEDYVDEVESTMNWDERTQTIRDQLFKAFRREKTVPWESLNGRERVRRLYRQFLRRKPEERTKTAREALQAEKGYTRNQALAFTDLYERARYSDQNVTEEEADHLRQTIK